MNTEGFAYTEELYQTLSKHVPTFLCAGKHKAKWLKFGKADPIPMIGEYTFDRQIGKGRCCEVKLAWMKGQSYAIKLIPLDVIDLNFIAKLDCELEALSLYRHPHIISVQEAIISNQYLGLVMEWARGGDLFHFLQLNGRIRGVAQLQKWFAQLISAVDFLHTHSFVHHDIKPENILINKDGNITLTDFEMGECFRRQGFPFVTKACGSVTYCAPEVMCSRLPYDACKADIWALGVTLYTMVVGYLPFNDHEYGKDTPQEIAEQYRYIMSAELKFPDSVEPQLRDLISGMLDCNPTSRISLPEIKSHAWLNGYSEFWTVPPLFSGSKKNSAGSLFSDASQHTINTLHSYYTNDPDSSEFRKPVRGPIIWDPEASCKYWQAPILTNY